MKVGVNMEKPHKKLDVWKKSKELAIDIYRLIDNFPKHEKYSLSNQMARAAVSIPSNIAEGAARNGKNEFAHFLSIAHGSLSELDTQIEIAMEIGYIDKESAVKLLNKTENISKMLSGLRKSLKK